MTTIGIISDIHADLDGLERALDLLRLKDVDEIWCAGDLVDRGADGNAVVRRIRQEQIPTVQGNHDYEARRSQMQGDEMLRFFVDDANLVEHSKPMMISTELTEINLTFLDYLPPARKFERDGIWIELTHSNTFDRSTYIYPTSRLSLFHETLKSTVADLIILGHTHMPMRVFQSGKLCIVNSGSVSKNYGQPERSCGILSLPEREFVVYDLNTSQPIYVPEIHLDEPS